MICEPWLRGDGWRHGWLGDTGTGKTTASRELVQVGGQLVLIHDDKRADPEFPGVKYFDTPETMLSQPLDQVGGLTCVAFRGDAYRGVRCEVEDVAQLALRFARARFPVRLVVDELNRACSESGRALESDALREAFSAGRAMKLSVAWSTQTPQRVPGVIFDQSSSIGLFRLGPKALNYLDERCMLDSELLSVVPTLAVGDFVLHRPGHPWDRCIYRFG